MLFKAFRIAWTLDVKIVWFGIPKAVCVNKWQCSSLTFMVVLFDEVVFF